MNTPARRPLLTVLVLILALVLSSCATATPGAAPTATVAPATKTPVATAVPVPPTVPATSGSPIVVGLLTDDSGALAIYGPMHERGFEIGLDYATNGTRIVAGRTIKFVLKDTASNPDTGVTLAREAIEKDGAKILVGVPSSAVALAVSAIAAQNKVVFIAEPAASTDITGKNFNPYTFRAGRNNDQDALTMGKALLKLGNSFIQISQDNAFGQASAAAFYTNLKGLGGSFPIKDSAKEMGTVFIPPDTTDFTPYLNQILDAKAKVLMITWSGTGFVPMFQQMQQLGVFKAMTVVSGIGDNQTVKALPPAAVGIVGVSVYHYSLFNNPINKYLTDEHIKRFKVPPDLWAESGFNAATMIVKALTATNGDTASDKLIAALEGMKFQGPKGDYTIRAQDHVLLQPMTLVKLVSVTDPDAKFVELVTLLTPDETAPTCAVPADQNRCK